MTEQEKEIGAKWLAILNAYSSDFSTKSLFNQTAAYLKTKHNGAKKESKFQLGARGSILTERVEPKPKPISLLEAAKIREAAKQKQEYEDEEQDGNILALDETGSESELNAEFKQKKTKKNV
jgi:hypothetical protein